MKRFRLLLLAFAPLVLGGCLPMMAASAVSMAAQGAQGRPQSNAQLAGQAREACTARAAQYGTVRIIDVEQARVDKLIVWGTVGDGPQKQSFQCNFGTKITGVTLRPIAAPR
jgi:hypothetical protein